MGDYRLLANKSCTFSLCGPAAMETLSTNDTCFIGFLVIVSFSVFLSFRISYSRGVYVGYRFKPVGYDSFFSFSKTANILLDIFMT